MRRDTAWQWVRLLRREILPQWGSRAPASLERAELRAWLEQLARRAPYVANRSGGLLRRICAWGVEQELLATNPCLNVPMPHRERPRERVLTLDEARAIWAAAGSIKRLGPAARLLLLTAAREREVLGMAWSDLDLRGKSPTWTLEGSKRKGGEPLVLPLVPAAVKILREIGDQVRPDPQWVFPARGAEGPTYWAQALAASLRTKTGIAFRIHDLRRTVASHLAEHGTSTDVIEAILGHRRPRLVRTYQRYAPLQAMRAALDWWASLLAG